MENYRLEQSGQEVQNILDGAAMQVDLTSEVERATNAEQTLQGNIDDEEIRAKAAEKQNADDIEALEEKIPSDASELNKLATEEYVNDSVSTATATFRGSYNLVSDLHLTIDATEQQIATALSLAIATADNNDYCFIQVPTSSETPTEIEEIERYKFNGTAWSFEYKLNNSGFTALQWAAINSGITSNDVTKLAALPTNAQLTTFLNGKQDVLTFDNTPTHGSNNPVKSGGVYTAEKALSDAIEAILLLIPSSATSLNQLADKNFVNASIATASATFRGTYNLVSDLSLTISATHAQIATALAGAVSEADNNDYAFVQIPTSDAAPTQIAKTERYKFNGTSWEYEYDLNNSGYTAAQWAAINSGITELLVTKLSALPTNSELTSELGALTTAINNINLKIPAAAAQNNKLIDTAALESYIIRVLDVLTVSYNVTSSDGHVTFHIEQIDGKITAVTLTTNDIASSEALNLKASQSDLTALATRVTTTEGNITSLDGRISTNEEDIAQLQAAYAALTQSEPDVIAPTDTWPVANPSENVIYRVVDRVNTPPESYSDYMWNGTSMVLMATYNNAIDDVPTPGSNNLVKSGGVAASIVYDISAANAVGGTLATYTDLTAALGTNGANVPSSIRKGGMSIKFISSVSNKYVQYRLMATSFGISIVDWQSENADNTPIKDSGNLVKSGGVFSYISGVNQKVSGLSKKIQGLSLGVNPNDDLIYIYINGKPIGDGVESVDVGTRYAIAWNLINVDSTSFMPSIAEGKSFSATLSAESGYNLDQNTVVVTMGGVDITATAYSNNTISIPSVTGNVSISAIANIIPSALLNVTWANHAITCGQDTNSYNAWCPHNLQYDFTNKCYVFLQCHANKHLNAVNTNWTLSVINPYDPNDYIDIPVPTFNGLGMLFIEGGVWYLIPRGGNCVYRSDNMGETWETLPASIPTYIFGVYRCGNKYFGGNDSNREITYYESDDLLTWETKSFDSTLGYNILCETSFCEYDGKWWAFNRTNNATLGHPVILQSTDKGATWTLFSDQMLHGYRSTIACLPFSDCLIVADIDRDNGYLYYNKFNGSTFEQLNSWKVPQGGDDFHNVNVVSNYEDSIVLAFMHGASGYNTTRNGTVYASGMVCDNVMLVGSTKSLPSVNFTYIDTFNDMADWLTANCGRGLNSERTYTYGNSGISTSLYCFFSQSITDFEDEIALPLNLVAFRGNYLGAILKLGDSFVQAWSNNVTPPLGGVGRAPVSASCMQALVNIGNHRYTLGINSDRPDALPVLTRQDYNYTLPNYDTTSTYISIVGKSWQQGLELRRVFSFRSTAGTSASDGCISNNAFAEGQHAFALVNYTPAM